jgi:hypothetical protein
MESKDESGALPGSRFLKEAPQNCLMSNVHPIKIAKAHHWMR